MRVILASASPRRAELLKAAGFVFEVMATEVDEAIRQTEMPKAYVSRLAAEKSARGLELATAGGGEPAVVIGADTAVVVGQDILGKPQDDLEAARMLRRLSGRHHEVITGVSLRTSERQLARAVETVVHFSRLSESEVSWYVGTGEGRDKAGGYAIQGLASRFIPRIEGSYSNVVGLPIATVVDLLRQLTVEARTRV